MACIAFLIHVFDQSRGRVEDQCGVTALCVRLARAVTGLAGHAFGTVGKRRTAVRIVGKTLYDFFVTGRADCGVCKVARIRLHRLVAVGIGMAWLSHDWCCAKHRRAQHKHKICSQAESWRFHRRMGG